MVSIAESVRVAIDSWERDEHEIALSHACIAVDGTATRTAGTDRSTRTQYVKFLTDRYWILEPMITPGINLDTTRFPMVPLGKNPAPGLAEIIYEVFRCNHLHGKDPPPGFRLTHGVGSPVSLVRLADGILQLPNNLIFGLLATVVLAPVNSNQRLPDDHYYLSIGHPALGNYREFPINQWWGRDTEFRPVAAEYTTIRVTLDWNEPTPTQPWQPDTPRP